MCSCRIGISFVTGIEVPESLLLPMSGVSRDGVLEWPAELGEKDDSDSLESRPPAAVSSCSFMLNEGIGGCCATPDTGLRCTCGLSRSAGGSGGRALWGGGAGAVSAIVQRSGDAGEGCCRCSGSISSVYPLGRVTGPCRCGAQEEAAVSISSSDTLQSSSRILLHVSALGAVMDTCFARAASLCRIVNPVDRLAARGIYTYSLVVAVSQDRL